MTRTYQSGGDFFNAFWQIVPPSDRRVTAVENEDDAKRRGTVIDSTSRFTFVVDESWRVVVTETLVIDNDP